MTTSMTPDREKLRQEAVRLRQELGWLQKDIARHLNVPQPTVNWWLHRSDGKQSSNGLDDLLQNCSALGSHFKPYESHKYHRRDATRIKYLTQDELTRLFDVIAKDSSANVWYKTPAVIKKSIALKRRNLAIFIVTYRHGLRVGEVAMLRIDDVDILRARIRIKREKGSLGGEYPMQVDEMKVLQSWLLERKAQSPYLFPSYRDKQISRRTLDWWMRYYGAMAGIPADKRHFHVLKHSICTHLLSAGAGIKFVQSWVGHVDINNTLIYSQLTDLARDKEAEKVFASSMIVQVNHDATL